MARGALEKRSLGNISFVRVTLHTKVENTLGTIFGRRISGCRLMGYNMAHTLHGKVCISSSIYIKS